MYTKLSWTTDLREIPDLSFLQLYQYLVVRTEKYGQNYLKIISYKKSKAFQFYYEGFIKMIEVATTPSFTYLNCKVKLPMKQTCYKVLLKFNNETSDVYAAMCTCPAGIGVSCLGKCNHIGSILFAMEDFDRKKGLKEFNEPLNHSLALQNYPNGMFQDTLLLPLPP